MSSSATLSSSQGGGYLLFNLTLLQFLLGPAASRGRVTGRRALGGVGEVTRLCGFVFCLAVRAARRYCCTSVFRLCPKVSASVTGFTISHADHSGRSAWGHRECTCSLVPHLSQDHSELRATSAAVSSGLCLWAHLCTSPFPPSCSPQFTHLQVFRSADL